MKTVLLPVKDFQNAKQRLSSALGTAQRAALARAMLVDVLDALSSASQPTRIIVYTASAEVMSVTRPFGFEIIIEREVQGHSAAVNAMLRRLCSNTDRLLVIASDLPRLCSDDVDHALTASGNTVTIVPSRDGTGTNGIVFVPPSQIEMEYGANSLDRHRRRAEQSGLQPRILHIDGIGFDIDTPDDLALFMAGPRLETETWRFLCTL